MIKATKLDEERLNKYRSRLEDLAGEKKRKNSKIGDSDTGEERNVESEKRRKNSKEDDSNMWRNGTDEELDLDESSDDNTSEHEF